MCVCSYAPICVRAYYRACYLVRASFMHECPRAEARVCVCVNLCVSMRVRVLWLIWQRTHVAMYVCEHSSVRVWYGRKNTI